MEDAIKETIITVRDGVAWFEDGTDIHATPELLKAAPKMLAALERFASWYEQHSPPELQGVACDVFAAIGAAREGA